MDIEWKDPPHSYRTSNETRAFVEALKSRPGQWAVYGVRKSNNGSNLRLKYPGTEWTGRGVEGGGFEMFGRWIGDT